MASGNTLDRFTPHHHEPTASNYATWDVRNDHPVLDFDPTTVESTIFTSTLDRRYNGGGLTLTIQMMATSAVAGAVVWGASIERIADGGHDLDADSFAAEKTVTISTSGTSGVITYGTITFLSGAEMDSLAVGETYRLKIRRVATDGADTMTGDAELLTVELRET